MSKSPSSIVWVVESNVFPPEHSHLADAARQAGHRVIDWDDDWWSDSGWPRLTNEAVVFHGSLGNAARIRAELPWRPGAFCNVERFHCSDWYPRAKRWMLNEQWQIHPASDFVANVPQILASLDCEGEVFVRPDSPLKPFSGRVLHKDQISLSAMDFGYYFDDPALHVVVSPVKPVGREWRFVIVKNQVVSGSVYDPGGRTAVRENISEDVMSFAATVASEISAPEDVYVMDVCDSVGQFRLLEMNPFSGADLYLCNVDAVVDAISNVAGKDCT